MTLNEKVAYIKGLAEGMNLDQSKPENKLINEIIELLEDMAVAVTDTEDLYDELSLQVDEIDEDLGALEQDYYDIDDCDCGCDCVDCDDCDDCDDECCDCVEDEELPDYQVVCPECDAKILVDEDTLLEGEISCPNCDNVLEFDFSGLFDEDGCACGDHDCDCCNHD